MLKKILLTLICLISTLTYSQKIKSIIEYRNEIDTIIKVRKSDFNKNGKLVKEVYFGGYDFISKTYRNRIKTIEYRDNQKILESSCEYFISSDTCITLPFSKYIYNKETGIEKRTFYDSDSLIISITETKKSKRKLFTKIYAWDFDPVEKPNYETAYIITDSIILDKKNRILKSKSYSKSRTEPIVEIYKYTRKGYTFQRKGSNRDTIIEFKYNKNQKLINRKKIKYVISDLKNYDYKFEYY